MQALISFGLVATKFLVGSEVEVSILALLGACRVGVRDNCDTVTDRRGWKL